jgi:hypothetical protein
MLTALSNQQKRELAVIPADSVSFVASAFESEIVDRFRLNDPLHPLVNSQHPLYVGEPCKVVQEIFKAIRHRMTI